MEDGYLFVHATDIRNLSKIIKDGYLDPNVKSKYRKYDYDYNDEYDYRRVWFQILDVAKFAPKKFKKHICFGGDVFLIFNENILKSQKGEYGGIAYPQNGDFDSRIDKKYSWLNEFVKSINEWMQFKRDRPKTCCDLFMGSHEIRMKNKVPLAPSLIGIGSFEFEDKQIIKYRKMLDKAGLDQCKIEKFGEQATYLKIAKAFRIKKNSFLLVVLY